MGTKIFKSVWLVLFFLITSSVINAQTGLSTFDNDDRRTKKSKDEPDSSLVDFSTYLFFNSLFDGNEFNYRRALRESRKNPVTISLGSSSIPSTELLKIFKKAANKADDSDAFRRILYKKNKNLENLLTDSEVEQVYSTFRGVTFNGYLAELRLALGEE